MDVKEKQIGKFFILNKELGKGAFAVCKKGCEVILSFNLTLTKVGNENKPVAVKIIDKNKLQSQEDKEKVAKELEHIKREISNLKALSCDHIIRILEIAQTSNNIYIFLEFANGGSLDQYIAKNGGKLSEKEALLIFSEMCVAFKAMQKENIIHRDIKPQNILIHNSHIKIADFGFSKVMDDANEATRQTLLGTPFYLPVEILTGDKYSSKCDVFSVGICLYELLYAKHPYYAGKKLMGIPHLVQELRKSQLVIPDFPKINPLVKDLLKKMLAIKEVDRISWEDIFNHPYFQQLEKEKQSNQSDLDKEQDTFKKVMMQSEMYLNDNLVGGAITKMTKDNKRAQDSVGDLVADNETNRQSQVPTEEQQSQLKKAYTAEQLQTEVKLIHEYILFERNIAVFYFNTLRKLWKEYNKKQLPVTQDFFYRLLYCLAKMGLLFLSRLSDLLVSQLDKMKIIKDVKLVDYFRNTSYYSQDKKLLESDKETQLKLFNELFKRAKPVIESQFSKETSPQNKAEIEQFLGVMDDKLEQTQNFTSVFSQHMENMLINVKDSLEKLDEEGLSLIRCLQIGRNPYKVFVFRSEEGQVGPDFHKFYEQLDKCERNELISEIKKSY